MWNTCIVSLKWLKGHSRFYHAQIIVSSVEDFCQMYAWIVEVILRLVNPTKDGLIITFCGVRNKSSGIFHSKWKCKLLSTSGSIDSHGTHFVFTFSENLYLQHLNGFKWWVFIHPLHFGAHPKESRGMKRFEAWEPLMMQLLLNLLDDWFWEQFSIRLNFRPNLDWHKGEKEKNPTERPGPGSISSYQDFWHFELLF